jgi:hypothetical protein
MDEYDDDDDGYAVDGDVMGMEVVGYDDDGTPLVVGKAKKKKKKMMQVRRPDWRARQLAPGLIAPDQGMLPLPLTGSTGSNTFTAALQTVTFEGQIQKPFRGERLLVSTVRVGASATGRLISQLFVGTDLQQLDVPGFDAEQVGTPNAFGVRLTMKPAQPGVKIRLVTTLVGALAGTDTIATTVTLLGRLVH